MFKPSLSNWKSQLILMRPSDDPAISEGTPRGCRQVTQQTLSGDFPCLGCQQITAGSPAGAPPSSCQRIAVLHSATCGIFMAIGSKILDRVQWETEQVPTGLPQITCQSVKSNKKRMEARQSPSNFNSKLKSTGRRPLTHGRVLDPPATCGSLAFFQKLITLGGGVSHRAITQGWILLN